MVPLKLWLRQYSVMFLVIALIALACVCLLLVGCGDTVDHTDAVNDPQDLKTDVLKVYPNATNIKINNPFHRDSHVTFDLGDKLCTAYAGNGHMITEPYCR